MRSCNLSRSQHLPPFGAAQETPSGQTGAGGAHAGPRVDHFRLENGMDVVVIPDHRAPVVTHMVWYRNGSADDPRGKSGIAHFLEHLMFKGTHRHKQGEFSHLVAELGGQENAFTSYDFTAYFQRVAREHLKTMMEFEADRMTGLNLTDEVVAPERDVVLEERRMRTEADPAAQLDEALNAALFTHHSYGVPIIGWSHEIETLDREDALAYYRRFYTPENAILVVAGDVEAPEVEILARETYGKIPARGEAPATPSPARARTPRRTHRPARRCQGRAAAIRAHLSGAFGLHRRKGRIGSARRAGPPSRRRPDQPAVPPARAGEPRSPSPPAPIIIPTPWTRAASMSSPRRPKA